MVGLWVAISTTLTYGRHNYEHSMHLETLLYLLCLCHGLIVNCGTCQVHVGPRHWLVDDTCIRRSVRRRQSSALYIKENLSRPRQIFTINRARKVQDPWRTNRSPRRDPPRRGRIS